MEIKEMYAALGVSAEVYEYGETILADLVERFREVDKIAEINQCKVLHAMQENRVNATHFAAT
ncbi:MAG: methionine gamma-lyase family protein, partial [Oscillospiraceae bacterium]|nr:methionine gamma-lyase family protein [Oscillospiraceae bacterium]